MYIQVALFPGHPGYLPLFCHLHESLGTMFCLSMVELISPSHLNILLLVYLLLLSLITLSYYLTSPPSPLTSPFFIPPFPSSYPPPHPHPPPLTSASFSSSTLLCSSTSWSRFPLMTCSLSRSVTTCCGPVAAPCSNTHQIMYQASLLVSCDSSRTRLRTKT